MDSFVNHSFFKRVLPLPSESWEEFGGGVFCHYHNHHGNEHSSSGGGDGDPILDPSAMEVAPRDGDCLFSVSALMVAKSSLELVRKLCQEHPMYISLPPFPCYPTQDENLEGIRCRRCLKILGNPMATAGIVE